MPEEITRKVGALVVAFLIGAASRWAHITVPAPPTVFGGVLIIAITLGYLSTDWWMTRGEAHRSSVSADDASDP